MNTKNDKTIKRNPKMKKSVLYIELREPYPQALKDAAERDNRSAKAQAEVFVMRALDLLDVPAAQTRVA